MTPVVAVAIAALGLFAVRTGTVQLTRRAPLPASASTRLRHAGIAVLGGLAVGSIVSAPSAEAPALIAAAVAAVVVARRTTSPTVVMAVALLAHVAVGAAV